MKKSMYRKKIAGSRTWPVFGVALLLLIPFFWLSSFHLPSAESFTMWARSRHQHNFNVDITENGVLDNTYRVPSLWFKEESRKPLSGWSGGLVTLQDLTSELRHIAQQNKISLNKHGSPIEAFVASEVSQNIFFFWLTSWASWSSNEDLFLQSLFLHHPTARVRFVAMNCSTELPRIFHQVVNMGYSLAGAVTSLWDLLDNEWYVTEANRAWLQAAIDDSTRFPLLPFHLSDYLRFFVLHEFGGMYTDTDSIFVQTTPNLPFMGLDASDNSADWFISPEQNLYVAPGVLKLPPRTNVVYTAMVSAFILDRYDPECYNCVGPRAFTNSLKNMWSMLPQLGFRLFPPQYLYPFPYHKAKKLFEASHGYVAGQVHHLLRSSYAVHLFNKQTRGLPQEQHSVMQMLTARNSLLNHGCKHGTVKVMGPPAVVLRGDRGQLYNAHIFHLQICGSNAPIPNKVTCTVRVENGLIDDAGKRGRQLSFVGDIQETNAWLSGLVYISPASGEALDQLHIGVTKFGNDEESVAVAPILVFHRMVSIMVHTHGRPERVQALHDSVQKLYPGTRVVASFDGNEQTELPEDTPTLTWLQLPEDVGLSVARNELLLTAKTEFVQLLDDDFTLNAASHLDLLLRVLHSSDAHIASAIIPNEELTGLAYRGLMTVDNGTLRLGAGRHGMLGPCDVVDFVPNVFMAKRTVLRDNVLWRPQLKLGEHEDFFLRAKQAGLKVLACPAVHVQHNQDQWWKESVRSDAEESYVKHRKRVFGMLRKALTLNNLKTLETFGHVVASTTEGSD